MKIRNDEPNPPQSGPALRQVSSNKEMHKVSNSLARFAHRIETLVDRFRKQSKNLNPAIDFYLGYPTEAGVVVRGRILSIERERQQHGTASLFNNIRAMVRNFATDEIADVLVEADGRSTRTDEEGYFTLEVPKSAATDQEVPIYLPEFELSDLAPIMRISDQAEICIISDIDDTIMQTGAWRLSRNLWTTFSQSAAMRHVFPDTVALLDYLHNGRNPVFYVSSSPWNLHAYLTEVFRRNSVAAGPLFLRDLGITETQFIKSSHGSHKGGAIDTIIAANPNLDVVLIGDTGQHDAAVYLEAIERHGMRIRQVFLRVAGSLDEQDLAGAKRIRDSGVPCYVGSGFDEWLAEQIS